MKRNPPQVPGVHLIAIAMSVSTKIHVIIQITRLIGNARRKRRRKGIDMIEIIKRRDGEPSQREKIQGRGIQVSYNDWGHLVVRVLQDLSANDAGADTLIVFAAAQSEQIIGFCQDQLIRRNRKQRDDLPF